MKRDAIRERVPRSDALERVVLGSTIGNPRETLHTALEMLVPDDFYCTTRAEVFRSVQLLASKTNDFDTVMVLDALRSRLSPAEFAEAQSEVERCVTPIPLSDIEPHCLQLRDVSTTREIARVAMQIAAEALGGPQDFRDFIDRAERLFSRALDGRVERVAISTMEDVCQRVGARLSQREIHGTELAGSKTGLADLDEQLGGLRDGLLYVIAGRPGMGKSALAQQFAQACASAGRPVLYFSLEMPLEELGERMLSSASSVDVRCFAQGSMSAEEKHRLGRARDELATLPIEFPEAESMTVEGIRRVARRAKTRHRALGCVVVDYLQLVRSQVQFSSRELEVASISRGLKLLAMELKCPVIAVAQLNRSTESRLDKRPMLSDLRESGAIEQDADVVVLLYRDEYYNINTVHRSVCDMIIAKHRGGPTGIVKAAFHAEFTRFGNLTENRHA